MNLYIDQITTKGLFGPTFAVIYLLSYILKAIILSPQWYASVHASHVFLKYDPKFPMGTALPFRVCNLAVVKQWMRAKYPSDHLVCFHKLLKVMTSIIDHKLSCYVVKKIKMYRSKHAYTLRLTGPISTND